jgi:hypothetical protein
MTFPRKNENRMEIWKRKRNFAKQKRKWNFLDESGNGISFSSGAGVETEFPFPTKVEFPFYRCSAWPI